MEMLIDFPGGARVDAHFSGYTVPTDQPPQGGGEGSAPTPFAVFLSTIGTCAGIYVLGFCRSRNLSTDGIRIIERINTNRANGLVDSIDLEIQVPPEFPEKYYKALILSAEQCKVKQQLSQPPVFNITTQVTP
jgi:ribosomal protein S12 methylthiotransferase accessory factor